ncbi:MAG TPA: hypothetical protein VKE70_18105 [Candidatus Solibacter sp.]|nr:hypothetical protein [Candidatus Solibacter sp.]
MQVAEFFVAGLAVYGLAGAVFAIAFVLFGIHRVDPVAEHSPIGFRLIVIPGAAVLWPLLLTRWFSVVSGSR